MSDKKDQVVKFPQVLIEGKIIKINSIETSGDNLYEHSVVSPNPDPYAGPGRCVVKSYKRLGNENEEISVVAAVKYHSYKKNSGGYGHNHDFWVAKEAA